MACSRTFALDFSQSEWKLCAPSNIAARRLRDPRTSTVLAPRGLTLGRPPRHDRTLAWTTWLVRQPSWLSGSDSVFDELLDVLPWNRPEVTMYDRVLEQPRSTAGWALDSRFDLPTST